MCLPYNLSCRGNHRNYLMNNIPWILWFGMMYCLSRRVSFSENVPSPSVKLIMLYWRETLTLFYGCLCPHINVCLSIKSKLAWANFYLISSLSHCTYSGKAGTNRLVTSRYLHRILLKLEFPTPRYYTYCLSLTNPTVGMIRLLSYKPILMGLIPGDSDFFWLILIPTFKLK